MASEMSKRRDLLALSFITKSFLNSRILLGFVMSRDFNHQPKSSEKLSVDATVVF